MITVSGSDDSSVKSLNMLAAAGSQNLRFRIIRAGMPCSGRKVPEPYVHICYHEPLLTDDNGKI